MLDAQITDPNDELYSLQSKYNVKISRSNKSDTVYVFRRQDNKTRIGHAFSKTSGHLTNFKRNFVIKGPVTKQKIEAIIIELIDKNKI